MRNRPPFIWTPKQPIEPMGFLSAMGHGTGAGRNDGVNRWFLFRRVFDLPENADRAPLNITCDGRYQLFVNGKRVGRGPVRSAAMAIKYDRYDIVPDLIAGRNVIAVLVHTYGIDTAFYEMVQGMWNPTLGDGGLWIDAQAVHGDSSIAFGTDKQWRVMKSDAWDSTTERMNSGLGFIESLDSRRLDSHWTALDFDDSGWDAAIVQHVDGGGPDAFFGGIDVEPFPILAVNPLPPLAEELRRPENLVGAYRVSAQSDMPVHEQIYAEPIVGMLADVATGHWNESADDIRLKPEPGEGASLLFRFDDLLSGYPFAEFTAPESTVIDIAVRETIAGEYEEGIGDRPRVGRMPVLGHDAHVARVIARGGRQRFERFEWSAARWLQITFRNAPDGVILHDVGVLHTHYPAVHEGAFECDDAMLNKLWALGRTTLQLCMHDGWEDCPSREQRQWLGDVTVEHAAAQAAFGPSANALTAKFLIDVADSQRPDGLTQMFAPGDHKVNGLLIPDWTLQWVLTAGDYLRYTGDVATIEKIFPAIQRALAWFEKLRTSNGLVADLPYWHFMDWAAVGRKGEAATLNAQLAGALKAAAIMADALEYHRAASGYRAVASEITQALNTRHWDEERGVYVDIVDPATGGQGRRVSQHANAAMILWGDAPPYRRASMIDRICDPDRLTFTAGPPIAPVGDPFNEDEDVVLANTFYSHFVYSALGKAGRIDAAIDLMRDRFGPMLAAGAVSLWESYGPTASLCHGFSASPTYQMTTHVLGLRPGGVGFATLDFDPDLGGLTRASGALATVQGRVEAMIENMDGVLAVTLSLPDELEAIISGRFKEEGHRLAGGEVHRIQLTPRY